MTRTVHRALAIFDAFDEEQLTLSLQAIGERIRMPKATTYRLVNTLEKAGFLIRLESQEYCLSMKLVRLAGLVRSTIGIREVSRPIMTELAHKTGDTVTINMLSGYERVCIDVVDTPSPLMAILRPGERRPLVQGATGKVLLAYLTPEELNTALKATQKSMQVDRKALDAELTLIRERGYSVTRSERIAGLTSIAVPIHDLNQQVSNCIALTGPSVRMDPRLQEFVDLIVAAGTDISVRLGSKPQSGGAHNEHSGSAERLQDT